MKPEWLPEPFVERVAARGNWDNRTPMTQLPPRVAPNSFLTLHYRLFGADGSDVINTFHGKPATLSLGNGELAPVLERKLFGLPEGTHTTFRISKDTPVFGARSETMLQWVSVSLLRAVCGTAGGTEENGQAHTYEVGEVVQLPSPDGQSSCAGSVRAVRAASATQDAAVLLDFNHPLASAEIGFEVHILGIL